MNKISRNNLVKEINTNLSNCKVLLASGNNRYVLYFYPNRRLFFIMSYKGIEDIFEALSIHIAIQKFNTFVLRKTITHIFR